MRFYYHSKISIKIELLSYTLRSLIVADKIIIIISNLQRQSHNTLSKEIGMFEKFLKRLDPKDTQIKSSEKAHELL